MSIIANKKLQSYIKRFLTENDKLYNWKFISTSIKNRNVIYFFKKTVLKSVIKNISLDNAIFYHIEECELDIYKKLGIKLIKINTEQSNVKYEETNNIINTNKYYFFNYFPNKYIHLNDFFHIYKTKKIGKQNKFVFKCFFADPQEKTKHIRLYWRNGDLFLFLPILFVMDSKKIFLCS